MNLKDFDELLDRDNNALEEIKKEPLWNLSKVEQMWAILGFDADEAKIILESIANDFRNK